MLRLNIRRTAGLVCSIAVVLFAILAALTSNGIYPLLAVLCGLAIIGLMILSKNSHIECNIAEQGRLQSLNAMNLACELHSMTVILQRFPACTLPTSSWSMRFSNLHKIVELLDERQPLMIIEFGSGLSTILIASWLESTGRGKLISFDHDPKWADTTKRHLLKHNLQDYAEVRTAPLKEIECDGHRVVWYDVNKHILDITDVDFMIVDGPPAALSIDGLSRLPALHQFRDHFSENYTIILDDANRSSEKIIVDNWLNTSNTNSHHTYHGLTGLSVIHARKDINAFKIAVS